MFNNMFKIYISIISFIVLILAIYSATIISIEYFDKNKKQTDNHMMGMMMPMAMPMPINNNLEPHDPGGGMRRFNDPNPQIFKNELELEKKQMETHSKREIETIKLQLDNMKNNNYELLSKQLELQIKNLEDNLAIDLMRMDLEIQRINGINVK